MKSEETALNFSTKEPERPRISIDEVIYELALAEDFTLREFLWLETKGREVLKHLAKGYANLDDSEFESLEKLLGEIAAKVLIDVPDEVMQRLQDSQKLQIVELFIETVGRRGETPRSDGTRSSPGSNDSTAEASKTG
jgi:hypothetical protein